MFIFISRCSPIPSSSSFGNVHHHHQIKIMMVFKIIMMTMTIIIKTFKQWSSIPGEQRRPYRWRESQVVHCPELPRGPAHGEAPPLSISIMIIMILIIEGQSWSTRHLSLASHYTGPSPPPWWSTDVKLVSWENSFSLENQQMTSWFQ